MSTTGLFMSQFIARLKRREKVRLLIILTPAEDHRCI
jgi:hypothetical protein